MSTVVDVGAGPQTDTGRGTTDVRAGWKKRKSLKILAVKRVAVLGPADELLVGRVVYDSGRGDAGGEGLGERRRRREKGTEATDSYNFWRKGGTTWRAARERWVDSPRGGRARATCVSRDMASSLFWTTSRLVGATMEAEGGPCAGRRQY